MDGVVKVWEIAHELLPLVAVAVSIASVSIAWRAKRRAVAIGDREERRRRIDILVRLIAPETEQGAIDEAFGAFYDSHIVLNALRRLLVGREVNEDVANGLREEAVKAMCKSADVDYSVFAGVKGYVGSAMNPCWWHGDNGRKLRIALHLHGVPEFDHRQSKTRAFVVELTKMWNDFCE